MLRARDAKRRGVMICHAGARARREHVGSGATYILTNS